MENIINKTMDRDDLNDQKCVKIVDELNSLMQAFRKNGLKYSSWYGLLDLPYGNWVETVNRGRYEPWERNFDDRNIPWFLLWEIAWGLAHIDLKEKSTLLDMGGASSLFSCYLASKGHKVYSIDLNKDLIENGNLVADKMGWDMKCMSMDMRAMKFEESFFDHIFSICVYEHIPFVSRIDINRNIAGILKPGGMFYLSFDYLNPDKAARISSPADIKRQFIDPSGLKVWGNETFFDNGKRYLESPHYLRSYGKPVSCVSRVMSVLNGSLALGDALKPENAEYTFGALFLKKA